MRWRFFICRLVAVTLLLAGLVAAWGLWGTWPDPNPVMLSWRPDAIVVLGGGDDGRVRQGKLLADQYPGCPVVVTGDGGFIMKGLKELGLPEGRIIHEERATSTAENAKFTKADLDRLNARRVVLVTNWFHAPRGLAVFRKFQPAREFAVSFEAKPEPLPHWDRDSQRRERAAALVYLLRYGVWSF